MVAPLKNWFSKAYTGAVTDEVIIDVGTNQTVRILSLHITNGTGATGTILLKSGSDTLVAALSAGASVQYDMPAVSTKDILANGPGTDITVTTTAGVAATVFITFELITTNITT